MAGVFVQGYLAALEEAQPVRIAERLASLDREVQGFAFEGAAMGLGLFDLLTPWNRGRVGRFLAGAGSPHVYMVHVGFGWALARLKKAPDRWLGRFDPLLRWLIVDGYGFHQTFFDWRRYVERRESPDELTGYSRRMFDEGLGRCLWFVSGADVGRIGRTVATFEADRRPDVWSGVGLACAYAGGVDRRAIELLRESAGAAAPVVAQGAAFAAKARQRAGNIAPHTELACEVLCGMGAQDAARVSDQAEQDLPPDGVEPAFETWRRRIQSEFGAGVAGGG